MQRAKLDALLAQDRSFLASTGSDDAVESAIYNYELAYRMQSLVPDVLNLDRESEATKKLYGLDTTHKPKYHYSLQCLRARRLIEAGVRFVEVTCPDLYGGNNGTWDQHNNLKENHWNNAFITDQGVTALIKDLRSRGILDETLVVWGTEFGRTPHTGNVARPRPSRDRLFHLDGRRRESRAARSTARPMRWACTRSRTSPRCTTSTPRSCTFSASITNA